VFWKEQIYYEEDRGCRESKDDFKSLVRNMSNKHLDSLELKGVEGEAETVILKSLY